MIKIIQNTDVINPCDYDQGSSMYMNCGDCIIKGCTRDAKHPPKFGEGKKCEDIPIKECDAAGIECDACAAWELMMEKLREFEAAHGKDVPSGGELYDILKKSMATVPKWKATI